MRKRVLILSSSPRRGGNSDLLCNQLATGATESGNFVEKIFLADKNIGYCIACDACKKHNGVCSLKDDMAEILQKMISADVIVMATPVYFYTVCAQLKTLIDRTDARYTEITDKEFYFIVTAAEDGKHTADRAIECLRGFTCCLPGAVEKGIIYGLGAWQKGEIKGSKAMYNAYEMGKAI